jgi:hypothetical protein
MVMSTSTKLKAAMAQSEEDTIDFCDSAGEHSDLASFCDTNSD